METVILRPGTFFGPGDRLHFGRMAQKMKDGKGVIIGRGDNALPFCYVTDVVQGFMLAAYHEKAPGNVYNITQRPAPDAGRNVQCYRGCRRWGASKAYIYPTCQFTMVQLSLKR